CGERPDPIDGTTPFPAGQLSVVAPPRRRGGENLVRLSDLLESTRTMRPCHVGVERAHEDPVPRTNSRWTLGSRHPEDQIVVLRDHLPPRRRRISRSGFAISPSGSRSVSAWLALPFAPPTAAPPAFAL